ncbi:MAG: acyltransferase family protein [Methanobacterium sp.]
MDILRAMAIIIIVFIHTFNYFSFCFFYEFLVPLYNWIVLIALNLFFFVSGYVLYYNYPKISSKTLKNFYYKRFKRIYPLYWFTIILGFGLSFFLPFWNKMSLAALLIVLLGLQGIFPPWVPDAKTLYWLWFVGVLLVYYLIYPFFTQSKNIIHVFLAALFAYLIILLLNIKLGIMEPLTNFYWVFFLGIALCWFNENYKSLKFNFNELFSRNNQKKLSLIYTVPILLIILIMFIYSKYKLYHQFDVTLELVFSTILVYLFVKIGVQCITKINKVFFQSKTYDLIKKISISSYATYLIHPIIFSFFKEIFLISNISESSTNFLMVFLVFPLTFLTGYYLQVNELNLLENFQNIKVLKLKKHEK